jgi:hypothetical protein
MTHDPAKRLLHILTMRRNHGSAGEANFIRQVLKPYDPEIFRAPTGERLAFVLANERDPAHFSGTLWSCHIDTMHSKDPGLLQDIVYDETMGMVYKEGKVGDCLGADDGAGVWLLLEMYDAGVPGTYIFHRGEERGGIGSSGMAAHHYAWLEQFDRAIAFDRRGTTSVITHQGVGRCCSTKFAKALCDMLTADADLYHYKPDDGGTFTDTANYIDFIGECTNVSVGYQGEHVISETLDVDYALALRSRMLEVGHTSHTLPSERKPGEVDPDDRWSYSWGFPALRKEKRTIDLSDMSVEEIYECTRDEVESWAKWAKPDDIATLILGLADAALYGPEPVRFDPDTDDDDGLGMERSRYAG